LQTGDGGDAVWADGRGTMYHEFNDFLTKNQKAGGRFMGGVVVEVTLENLEDLWAVRRGSLPADQVRKVVVPDALVDTGATLLSLPTRVIQALGLQPVAIQRVTSSAGVGEATLYDTVRLTVLGRSCGMDVIEVPDTVPVLVGQIPLEHLDFTIDMRGRSLIGNPAHGGEHLYELF
jgi:predicted aspartyl protease